MSETYVEQASWYMVLGGALPINNENDGKVIVENSDIESDHEISRDTAIDENSDIESDHEISRDTAIDENSDIESDHEISRDTAIVEIESEGVADFTPGRSYICISVIAIFIAVGLVITFTDNVFLGICIWTTALIALITTTESAMIDPALCWIVGFILLTAFNTAIGILIFTKPSVALALVISQACIILPSLSRLTIFIATISDSIDHNPVIELAVI